MAVHLILYFNNVDMYVYFPTVGLTKQLDYLTSSQSLSPEGFKVPTDSDDSMAPGAPGAVGV